MTQIDVRKVAAQLNLNPCFCPNPNGFIHHSTDYANQTQKWIHVKCGGYVIRPALPSK